MTIEATDPCVRGLRLALVSAGALLESLRLIKAGEGNLSARVSPNRCLITPTGLDKGRLDPSDLVTIDVHGPEIPPGASSEARLHTTAYSRFPDVAAVVHAHPPQVQVLAGAGRVPDCDLLLQGQQLLTRVGGVGPMAPGSHELADAVAQVLSETQACVLDRHGAVTVGRTVDEAMRRMLLLERVANLTVASLGR
jgi:L-fuculose-phosphate aldolase